MIGHMYCPLPPPSIFQSIIEITARTKDIYRNAEEVNGIAQAG